MDKLNKGILQQKELVYNLIVTKLKVAWTPFKRKALEVFNYNSKESKERFQKLTTETKHLSQIVDMKKPLDIVTKKFLKRLKGFIHECFNKVKIVEKSKKELEHLYDKRRVLRNRKDMKGKTELEAVENELSSKYSEVMANKILKEVQGLEDAEDGGFNSGKLWKLKRKLSPKANEPPTAMESKEGKLLTDDDDIFKEAVRHYKAIFAHKNITLIRSRTYRKAT